jgi:hypothetical protein
MRDEREMDSLMRFLVHFKRTNLGNVVESDPTSHFTNHCVPDRLKMISRHFCVVQSAFLFAEERKNIKIYLLAFQKPSLSSKISSADNK